MSKRKLILSLIVICVFAIFLVIGTASGVVLVKILNNPEEMSATLTNETTTEQTVYAVPKTTEASQVTEATQPPELADLLDKTGHSFKDLEGTNQLVTVTGSKEAYYLQCYEFREGKWQSTNIKAQAHIGRNGTVSPDEKTEGDYYSPQGLYDFGFAFGKNKNPGTKMEYRDVYEGVYWVDDPKSELYNQWVDGKNQEIGWASAEKLWTYDEYIYGAVIEYNTDPVVENKGSAIFLHVGYKYTAGCVASDEATIVSVLKWLNPEDNPKILIY